MSKFTATVDGQTVKADSLEDLQSAIEVLVAAGVVSVETTNPEVKPKDLADGIPSGWTPISGTKFYYRNYHYRKLGRQGLVKHSTIIKKVGHLPHQSGANSKRKPKNAPKQMKQSKNAPKKRTKKAKTANRNEYFDLPIAGQVLKVRLITQRIKNGPKAGKKGTVIGFVDDLRTVKKGKKIRKALSRQSFWFNYPQYRDNDDLGSAYWINSNFSQEQIVEMFYS